MLCLTCLQSDMEVHRLAITRHMKLSVLVASVPAYTVTFRLQGRTANSKVHPIKKQENRSLRMKIHDKRNVYAIMSNWQKPDARLSTLNP